MSRLARDIITHFVRLLVQQNWTQRFLPCNGRVRFILIFSLSILRMAVNSVVLNLIFIK